MQRLMADRNLLVIFGVTLMMIMGVSSIMPVLATLTTELGVQQGSIGLVLTVFAFPGFFLAPVIGVLADRVGRKKILVLALIIYGVFGGACSLADSFETLILFRFLQGIGLAPLGILSATVIGDLYEGQQRITAMGYQGMVLGMGTAVLPMVGGGLAMFGWRYPFVLPVLSLPLALLVYLFLKNPEPRAERPLSQYFREALHAIWNRNAIGLFLLTMLTLIIMYGPFVTYVPLLLQDRFGASPVVIGVCVAVSSLFAGLASSQLGRVAGSLREVWILRISFVMFLVAMVAIPLMPSLLLFGVPLAVFGMALGLGSPSRITMISGLASTEQRAAVLAVNSLLQRAGQTVSPVLAGAVLTGFGFNAVFVLGAGVALCMIAISFWLVE